MVKRLTRTIVLLAFAWFVINLALVVASWGRSYFAKIEEGPQVLRIDTRADKAVPGRLVTLIATRPSPSKGDYIGHMWVAWPQTPPLAPNGSREGGYYADSHSQAIMAMAGALLAPWGGLTGQAPVGGHMKVDDGWWRHIQIDVTVDEARYQAALAVDSRWRRERRYSLRPGLAGFGGHARTWACQDYVFEVADALGLRADRRDWKQFPMEAFLYFARDNGLSVKQ
jgi:hypothetical protein